MQDQNEQQKKQKDQQKCHPGGQNGQYPATGQGCSCSPCPALGCMPRRCVAGGQNDRNVTSTVRGVGCDDRNGQNRTENAGGNGADMVQGGHNDKCVGTGTGKDTMVRGHNDKWGGGGTGADMVRGHNDKCTNTGAGKDKTRGNNDNYNGTGPGTDMTGGYKDERTDTRRVRDVGCCTPRNWNHRDHGSQCKPPEGTEPDGSGRRNTEDDPENSIQPPDTDTTIPPPVTPSTFAFVPPATPSTFAFVPPPATPSTFAFVPPPEVQLDLNIPEPVSSKFQLDLPPPPDLSPSKQAFANGPPISPSQIPPTSPSKTDTVIKPPPKRPTKSKVGNPPMVQESLAKTVVEREKKVKLKPPIEKFTQLKPPVPSKCTVQNLPTCGKPGFCRPQCNDHYPAPAHPPNYNRCPTSRKSSRVKQTQKCIEQQQRVISQLRHQMCCLQHIILQNMNPQPGETLGNNTIEAPEDESEKNSSQMPMAQVVLAKISQMQMAQGGVTQNYSQMPMAQGGLTQNYSQMPMGQGVLPKNSQMAMAQGGVTRNYSQMPMTQGGNQQNNNKIPGDELTINSSHFTVDGARRDTPRPSFHQDYTYGNYSAQQPNGMAGPNCPITRAKPVDHSPASMLKRVEQQHRAIQQLMEQMCCLQRIIQNSKPPSTSPQMPGTDFQIPPPNYPMDGQREDNLGSKMTIPPPPTEFRET